MPGVVPGSGQHSSSSTAVDYTACLVMRRGACRESWQRFGRDVAAAEKASMAAEKGFAFAFVEGALVRAVREGWWLLLDEINLAPAEVCSRLASESLCALQHNSM